MHIDASAEARVNWSVLHQANMCRVRGDHWSVLSLSASNIADKPTSMGGILRNQSERHERDMNKTYRTIQRVHPVGVTGPHRHY